MICRKFGVPLHVYEIPALRSLGNSALVCGIKKRTRDMEIGNMRRILMTDVCMLGPVRCLLLRQRTQASVARAVVIQRKKIACHKVNSDARYVDIQRTPM
ncbi:hypothetical protein AP1_0452 [Aeromonas phage AP1]|nr:hypothetical protein AP1_0452 [Aeromonas phage AP1]